MSDFKPLLSATCEDIRTLRFPVLASPKLDGIRCVKIGGKALTRKLKPIPNDFVRTWIEANLPDGIDGELMLRDHRASFSEVSSAIMSRAGEPDFVFCAFDFVGLDEPEITLDLPFDRRLLALENWMAMQQMRNRGSGIGGQQFSATGPRLLVVEHHLCRSGEELEKLREDFLAAGYEGTMVRDPNGRYKFGRSTLKEQILCKIKAWADEEAVVIGAVEQMHNANEATRDAVGNVKRSSAKAGKVGTGKLGALICRTEDGVEFEIGTGFTDAQRVAIWKEAEAPLALAGDGIIGLVVKFRHQPPPGGRAPGSAPRFPVFLGWRED